MTTLSIIRRNRLGLQSTKGLMMCLNDLGVATERDAEGCDWLLRWGTRVRTSYPSERQLNKSEAIATVSDKLGFRVVMATQCPDVTTNTLFNSLDTYHIQEDYVLRPAQHAQGRHVYVMKGRDIPDFIIANPAPFCGGWYATRYVEKTNEYRVFMVENRVVAVAEKTPDDPNAVAWNMAQGATMSNVKWGDWNMNVCHAATVAFSHTGLDFGGVDVMLDADGNAYVLEINSGPTIMMKSNGEPSYRHQCLAKGIHFRLEYGRPSFFVERASSWKDYIHPAIWSS